MYNSTQKQRYMDDCKYEPETIEGVVRVIFNATELAEETTGMDLANFNKPQIVNLLKSFNSKSPRRLDGNCIYLSDYYKWCLNNGIVSSVVNPYDKNMVEDIIDLIIPIADLNNKYFTKLDVLDYMYSIPDVTNQFMLYGLFSGVKGKNNCELVNLKIEDLDEENKTVTLITGRVIHVDDLFIKLMKLANDAEEYYYDGVVKDAVNGSYPYTYVQNGYVLKQCQFGEFGKTVGVGITNPRFNIIKTQSGNNFVSASTIYKNGLINYIKEKFDAQGINLENVMMDKTGREYDHQLEIQKYIDEYGSKTSVRMLRSEIKYYLDCLK